VAKFLLKQNFDIFHSFVNTALAYLMLRTRKITVAQGMGYEPLTQMHFVSLPEFALNVPFGQSVRYCLSRADKVLSLGSSFTNYASEKLKISPERIFELSNGVPVSDIKRQIQSPQYTRASLGLSPEDFVIIDVGRLVPLKGHEYLIEALRKGKEIERGFKLVLIGAGPSESKLLKMIACYGLSRMVIHLKNLNEQELYSAYAIADLAVLPILDVSGPDLTILEAMSAGLPVITTSVWENPTVIKHGVNGYLVPPGDSGAIAEAMIEAYRRRNELRGMGEVSANLVRQYDWANVAKKAAALYENLA
jgi:glycosyltransferase involved in cell wall biosynthesis